MSLNQTGEGLSRREVLGLGVAGLLTSLRPKAVEAREGDKRPERIYLYMSRRARPPAVRTGGIYTVDPENDSWQSLVEDGGFGRVSPDGSTLAYFIRDKVEARSSVVRLLNLDTKETKPVMELSGGVSWSPDGKELIVWGSKLDGRNEPKEVWKIDVADPSKKVRLPIVETDEILDMSPDCKTLLVRRKPKDDEPSAPYPMHPASLVGLDGKDLGRVLEPGILRGYFRFTRDGKRIVYTEFRPEKEKVELWSVGVDGKDNRLFLGERETDAPCSWVAFSPDGKRMAVSYFDRSKRPDGKKNPIFRDCHLEILDSKGANPRRVALPDDFAVIYPLDWR